MYPRSHLQNCNTLFSILDKSSLVHIYSKHSRNDFFLACHSNSVIHLSASALIYLLSNGVRKVPLHLRDCMAKIIYNS